MEMTELDEYPLAPGLLREWVPHCPELTEAADSARDDSPPSYNQEWHFRGMASLHDRGITTPAWLGTGFEVSGRLDHEAFRAALHAWIERHETLRSSLRSTEQGLERFTLPADRVRITDAKLGELLADDDINGIAQARLDAATDGNRWPNYSVHTLERDTGTTVLVAYDHANVDGYSVLATPQELHELYADCLRGDPPRTATAGSYVQFSRAERSASDRVGPQHPVVTEWDRFIRDCGGNLPGFPLDLGVREGELLPHTGARRWVLDAAGAESFEQVCRRERSSVLAGALAASAAVAGRWCPDSVYRVVSPFHTRTRPEWASAMGWYVGAGPVEIPLDGASDFLDLLPAAQVSARDAMRMARVPFAKVVDLLGLDLQRYSPDVFSFVSYLDMREVPGSDRWSEWNARTLVRMSYGDKANVWVNRTHEGICLTARYPRTRQAHEAIERYFRGMGAVLGDVAYHGEYALT